MIDSAKLFDQLRLNAVTEASSVGEVERVLTILNYSPEERQRSVELLKSRGWFKGETISAPTPIYSSTPAANGILVSATKKIPDPMIAPLDVSPVVPQTSIVSTRETHVPNRIGNMLVTIVLIALVVLAGIATVGYFYIKNHNNNLTAVDSMTASSSIQLPELFLGGEAADKITVGSSTEYDIPVTRGTQMGFLMAWDGSGLSLRLIDPSGNTTNINTEAASGTSAQTSGTGSNQKAVEINGSYLQDYLVSGVATPGIWKLIASNNGASTINFGVQMSGYSNIFFAQEPSDILVSSGKNFQLSMAAYENTSNDPLGSTTPSDFKPIPGLDVIANIASASATATGTKIMTIPLQYSADASNATSSMYLSAPAYPSALGLVPGDYYVYYTATGVDNEGEHFAQKSSGAGLGTLGAYLSISAGEASLSNPQDSVVDIRGDGVADSLELSFSVNIQQSGDYALDGLFVAPNGKEFQESTHIYSVPVGATTTSIVFNPSDEGVTPDSSYNGIWKVENIQLVNLSSDINFEDSYPDYTMIHSYTAVAAAADPYNQDLTILNDIRTAGTYSSGQTKYQFTGYTPVSFFGTITYSVGYNRPENSPIAYIKPDSNPQTTLVVGETLDTTCFIFHNQLPNPISANSCDEDINNLPTLASGDYVKVIGQQKGNFIVASEVDIFLNSSVSWPIVNTSNLTWNAKSQMFVPITTGAPAQPVPQGDISKLKVVSIATYRESQGGGKDVVVFYFYIKNTSNVPISPVYVGGAMEGSTNSSDNGYFEGYHFATIQPSQTATGTVGLLIDQSETLNGTLLIGVTQSLFDTNITQNNAIYQQVVSVSPGAAPSAVFAPSTQ